MKLQHLVEKLKKSAGYNGKPQQWQYGFDLACREIEYRLNKILDGIQVHGGVEEAKKHSNVEKLPAGMEHVILELTKDYESLEIPEPVALTEHQKIVITGYTMIACVQFSVFHADCERRLGRPIFTHEFPSLKEEIKAAYKDDFMKLLGESK